MSTTEAISEDGGTATFTISATPVPTGSESYTVSLETPVITGATGSWTSGDPPTAVTLSSPRTITLNATNPRTSYTFTSLSDNADTSDGSITLTISKGAASEYTIGTATATLRVKDNDNYIITSSLGGARASEGTSFTLNITAPPAVLSAGQWSLKNPSTAGPKAVITPSSSNPGQASVIAYLDPANTTGSYTFVFTSGSDSSDFELTVNGGNIDLDGDGLIEIRSLTMLHNMRYNLAGTSYKTSEGDTGTSTGCPSSTCAGYELPYSLSFDKDGDGKTWEKTGSTESPTFTLDADDNQEPYFLVADGGWLPVGNGEGNTGEIQTANSFRTTFEGNGHTITGLAIRRSLSNIGLFGRIDGSSRIRNIGLEQNLVTFHGTAASESSVGGLVGRLTSGDIVNSYAQGDVSGSDLAVSFFLGGLVGYNFLGNVVSSFSTGNIYDISNADDYLGGLAGYSQGRIIASYANSNAYASGSFINDQVGGLVGWLKGGSIFGSYATGMLDGGAGAPDFVGGLVGTNQNGRIVASYATGNADGGDGNGDSVGKLFGLPVGTVTTTASYGFGTLSGKENNIGNDGTTISNSTWTAIAESDRSAARLTLAIANDPDGTGMGSNYNKWDNAAEGTKGAWDFGSNSQAPALKFADYDGNRSTVGTGEFPLLFHCEGEANPPSAAIIIPNCGELIPGQR